jgi:membrane fusion protein, multidrug efflux system
MRSIPFLFMALFFFFKVGADNPEEPGTKITTTQPTLGKISQISAFLGTVRASQSLMIKAEIPAKIKKIYFKEGTFVKKGDPLFSLEDATYKAELDSAEASFALSSENLKRAETLFNKASGTKLAYDQALSQFKKDQLQVVLAKNKLSKTQILAPFEGLVGFSEFSEGAYLAEGNALVGIEDLTPLYIDFFLPEKYVGKVKQGNAFEIHPVAFPKKELKGTFETMDSHLDAATRQLKIRVRVDQHNFVLRPGHSVEVLVNTGIRENVLLVPQLALQIRTKGTYAYRIVNGKSVETPVTMGWRQKEWVEIKKGLSPNDVIAYEGAFKLSNDEKVEIVNDVKKGMT